MGLLLNLVFIVTASAQWGWGNQGRSQWGSQWGNQQRYPSMYPSTTTPSKTTSSTSSSVPSVPSSTVATSASAPSSWFQQQQYQQSSRFNMNPYGRPQRYQSMYPSTPPAAPAAPAAAAAVSNDAWLAALAKMGLSAPTLAPAPTPAPKPVAAAAVSNDAWLAAVAAAYARLGLPAPNQPMKVDDPNTLPQTSPSSYPQSLSEPRAAAAAAARARAAAATPAAVNVFTPAVVAPVTPAVVAPVTVAPAPAPAKTNTNSFYAQLPSDIPKRERPVNYNNLYAQLPQDRSRADIEASYGAQMDTGDELIISKSNDYKVQDGKIFQKKKLRSLDKSGPTIGAGGQFRTTAPSVENMNMTGRPVVSYDFHGVIQNCPGPNQPCKLNERVVEHMAKDSLNYDIIIVTAGVDEGNPEMIEYLQMAGAWKFINRLYNSGSKWEVMIELGVIAHYDDLMDNLKRINSRATGIALVYVDADTQEMRRVT